MICDTTKQRSFISSVGFPGKTNAIGSKSAHPDQISPANKSNTLDQLADSLKIPTKWKRKGGKA